jgi:hypothetical protein
MPCIPRRPRNAADGAEAIHPIALQKRPLLIDKTQE